jgi:hypothetical protein
MEGLLAGQLSGWDFLIAGFIVLFVEFPIKTWICKKSENLWWLYKWAPVVLGAITYVVMALIQGTPWLTGAVHGLGVGFAAMGEYDLILKTMKQQGLKSATDMNEAVKKAIEEKK